MKSEAQQILPRGMSRPESAAYIGVGVCLWDEMVADGRMPQPKEINKRIVWDRWEVDTAFSNLPNRTQEGVWDSEAA